MFIYDYDNHYDSFVDNEDFDILSLGKDDEEYEEEMKCEKKSSKEAVMDEEEMMFAIKTVTPMIKGIARKFIKHNNDYNFEDLVQEGTIASYKALQKYDASKNVAITTYLRPWVHGAIYRYVCSNVTHCAIPDYRNREIYVLKKTLASFKQINGREPTIEELSKEMNEDIDHVNNLITDYRIFDSISKGISIDETFDDSNGNSKHEVLTSGYSLESEVVHNELKATLENAINKHLSQKQQEIIMRKMKGESSTKIGIELQISRQTVNNNLKAIYKKLEYNCPELKQYIEY